MRAYFNLKNFKMKVIYKTVKDFAKDEGVTEKTVYNRIKSGAIPKSKVKKVLSTTLIEC